MKINDTVLDILGNCRVEGNILYLPDYQLDRADYVATNKVLESLGGKWNRKEKGHIFDYCPQDALDNVILTGEYTDIKKELQFFPTPREIAEQICDWAEISSANRVLEPSVGKGDLADAAWEYSPEYLFGLDINVDMNKYLAEKPYDTQTGVDFLEMEFDSNYDRIVMNPPFSCQQDIDHIYKAFDVLEKGGIMVSVVSKSPFFRTNEKSLKFRAFLEEHYAMVEDLPEGAFKESGTMVRACLIKIVKEG